MTSTSPSGARVARHTLLSFAGMAVPLAIALFAIPITATGLGAARFGLLGLSWATVEYLGLFDVGLSRSTIRFVADSLARGGAALRQIVAVSLATQFVLGAVAGALVWMAAPLLASGTFSIPVELQPEAEATFRVVALNISVVIWLTGMRSVLEGAQRFAAATAFRIPTASAGILIPAIGALAGASLPQILLGVLAARLVIMIPLFLFVPRAVPGFAWEFPREWGRLVPLLRYGGWVAVTSVATPVLVSLDRLVLGIFAGVAAVGFYTAPYEGATRLLLIPISVFASLLPALAHIEAGADSPRRAAYLESALRQLAFVLIPAVVALLVFGPEILRLWIGGEFAEQGGLALRILAVGVLVNALAHVPSVYLYAAGRPDLPAKLHVAELFFHVPLTFYLVRRLGIPGAALAWTIRVCVDAAVLAFFAWRMRALGRAWPTTLWLRLLALAVGTAAAFFALSATGLPLPLLAAAAAGALALYAASGWQLALSGAERQSWRSILN